MAIAVDLQFLVVPSQSTILNYSKGIYFLADTFLLTFSSIYTYSLNQKCVQLINNSLWTYIILIVMHTVFSHIYSTA